MNTDKAFTLIEILVVVLIIGILAAIALPQYQKAVLKADLHRGINLVESLYQAQQAYYLATGDFAGDIDMLDVSFAKDASCTKGTSGTSKSWYDCDFGRIYNNKDTTVQFQNRPGKTEFANTKIAYAHYLQDDDYYGFKAGDRSCFAKPNYKISQDVCKEMGGTYISESGSWIYYKLP